MKLSYVLFILFITALSILGHSLHNRRTSKLSTVPYSFLRITEYNTIHPSPNNTMKDESITEKPVNTHLPLLFDLHRDTVADESVTSNADASVSSSPNPSSMVESVESVLNAFSPTSGSSETTNESVDDPGLLVVNTTSAVENESGNENEDEGGENELNETILDQILFSKTTYSLTPYPEQEEMLREVLHYNINYNDTSIQSRDWDLVVCTTYEGVVSDVLMLFTNNLFLLLLLFLLLFLFNTLIL